MRSGIQRVYLVGLMGLTLIVLFLPSLGLAKDEFRAWSDSKGKSKIKAKFVKLEDDVVTLEKEDGDEVEIELKKLSSADQKFVADAVKEADDNPFKKKADSPSKPKPTMKMKESSEDSDDDETPEGFRMISVNMKTVKMIKLTSQAKNWKVDLSGAKNGIATDPLKVVGLPPKSDFFEALNGFVLNRGEGAKTTAVSLFLQKQGEKATTRLVIGDLSTGKSQPPFVVPGNYQVMAIHDDGNQVVMRKKSDGHGWGKEDHLEVWRLKDAKVARLLTWIPYDFEKGGARDVQWAQFVDKEKLATGNSEGRIIFWKFPDIKPLSALDTSFHGFAGISADRKLLAYATRDAVGVIDLQKMKILGHQAAPGLFIPHMAFSPSSKRFGCIAHDKVLIWETSNGKLLHTIDCDGIFAGGSIEFIDENFVLVGKSYLIELENELKLWRYQDANQVQSLGGTAIFAVSDGVGSQGALIPLKLPHPTAKNLMANALENPDQFALREGVGVRIDVTGIPDASQRDRVTKSLTKQLAVIKCTVDSNSAISLVASVEGPKQIEVSYIGLGDHKFQEYRTHIKFVLENVTLWQTLASNNPSVVQLKKGETIENHLREREKPAYDFYDRIKLPKFLQKPVSGQAPGDSLTIGTSKVTTNGLK